MSFQILALCKCQVLLLLSCSSAAWKADGLFHLETSITQHLNIFFITGLGLIQSHRWTIPNLIRMQKIQSWHNWALIVPLQNQPSNALHISPSSWVFRWQDLRVYNYCFLFIPVIVFKSVYNMLLLICDNCLGIFSELSSWVTFQTTQGSYFSM